MERNYGKELKSQRGITLIALVMTIIVLLILAGVSIATLTGENGILTQATGAKEKTEIAEAKEQAQLDIAAWRAETLQNNESIELTTVKIKEILTGKRYVKEGSIGNKSFKTAKNGYEILYSELDNNIVPTSIEEAKIAETAFKKNTEIKDEYGNKVTVPEGFKVASDSATDVTGGVVIEDVNHTATAGSQFVWIPVGKIYTNADATSKESTAKTINLNRYTFADDAKGTETAQGENTIDSYCQELATSSYGNKTAKAEVLEAFKNKTNIQRVGGYYIGRYEARVGTKRTDQTDDLGQITVKPDDYVYNLVTQSQAASLAGDMYSSSSFTSDLINSYAWDTAIVFVQTFDDRTSKKKPYSRQNSLNGSLAEKGTTVDKICNIYDMASNANEWTTETFKNSNYPCIRRGGEYVNVPNFTGCRDKGRVTDFHSRISFRPILYVK